MTRRKTFTKVERALLAWIKKVKNAKVGKMKMDYSIDYVIDKSNPRYLEFRYDSDIYEIVNGYKEKELHHKFIGLLQRYNGDFETYSIVRFY